MTVASKSPILNRYQAADVAPAIGALAKAVVGFKAAIAKGESDAVAEAMRKARRFIAVSLRVDIPVIHFVNAHSLVRRRQTIIPIDSLYLLSFTP